MRFKLIILFLSGCLALNAQGPISGFYTAKGEIALALSYSSDRYDTYLNPAGNENRELAAISYSAFIEAGLGNNSSIVATLPYISTGENTRGLQDASIWLKYLNLQNRDKRSLHNVFTAIGLSFPIGNYVVDDPAAIGQKATVFQGRLAYQLQHDDGWFISAISGIDFQFAPDSRSAIPLLLRAGYGGPFFYVEGWFELVRALEGGIAGQTALAGTGSSWNRVGLTGYVPVFKWLGFTIGGAWITSGKFIGQSSRVNLGTVFKI